ncbi:MAG TPA: hypothetical protein VFV86_02360 [Nitrososphaeraceae archaeon]|nr:hypothetical protein [Nitrososphaeraceae archaeon]
MKILLINTPWGQYKLLPEVIASNRADYYACEVDGFEIGSEEWKEEVGWVLNDEYELKDWMLGNMNWEDIKDIATKVSDRILVSEPDFWRRMEDIKLIEV